MRQLKFVPLVIIVSLALLSCSQNKTTEMQPSSGPGSPPAIPAEKVKTSLESITSSDLLRHIGVLASDEFEGRAPGSKGEELTVKYLTDEFKKLGLKPGNPDGTYIQNVPLAGFTASPTVTFVSGQNKVAPRFPDEYVAVSRRFVPQVEVQNSDVVFVGYGVVAPEYGWDDYKDVDVKGKTILMLINDPAIPDPSDPAKLDERMFKGKAMTYYGRWTYKYEIATEKGAAAAVIIHEEGPAGYPYKVVSGSWGRENFDIQKPDKNMGRVSVESWMSLETARKVLSMAGQDFDALKRAALSKDFKPVALNLKANFSLKNKLRQIQSRNVVAKLEGSDPELKNQYLIYSAHWDHLGKDPKKAGDQIFNGAVDNASGTAGLLELAEAYTKLASPPKRSILFLSVTAEEKGLLGSKYYAQNPLYPLKQTAANINMDGVNQWGKTKDIVVIGMGNTTVEDVLRQAAQGQGRVVEPDPEPEKGLFYRSDHFEFAKMGVPALDPDSGTQYIGKPQGYGKQKRDEYTGKDYHNVSDEIKPDWDLSGAVEDLQLLFITGYQVAQDPKLPEWKPGTEFRAKRDAMIK
jgi:Zn-dependent M28 family amino/carboxypeptidase